MSLNKFFTIIIFLFCFYINNVKALLLDPGTATTNQYTKINSAYGPRNTDGSVFHDGIDYRIRHGVKGYAIEDGVLFTGNLSEWM